MSTLKVLTRPDSLGNHIVSNLILTASIKKSICELFAIESSECDQVMSDSTNTVLWRDSIPKRGYDLRFFDGLEKFLKFLRRSSHRDPFKKIDSLEKQMEKQMVKFLQIFQFQFHFSL